MNLACRPTRRLHAAAWLLLALGGCTNLAPHYQVPVTRVPVAYKEASTWQRATPQDGQPRGAWWMIYGDPTLDTLEGQVNTANPTLDAALSAFQQAREIAAEANAGLFPSLVLGGRATENRQSDRRPLRSRGQPNQYLDNAIDVQADYEIDLWGRVANSIRAGRAAAQATLADVETLRLSLHAELANDYVLLRGLDAQAKVLQDTVRAYRQALALTEARFAGKIASGIDVTRAQAQLGDAEAQLTDVSVRRALQEHAIAVLVGKLPAQLSIPPAIWTLRDAEVPAGLPSTLLERRPDVASAERLMAAANDTIGETRAAFYPTISLNLLYGLEDTGFNIFSLSNDMWTLGPGLVMPLFEGGLRDAELAAAIAAYKEQAARYRETVLGAFQEVEDALAERRLLAQEAVEELQAVTAARKTVDMTLKLYKDGATSYLEVVTAQAQELTTEQRYVDLRTRELAASVNLIRALGGGWNRRDLPALRQLATD